MPDITFMPGGTTVSVPAGTPLHDAAKLAGITTEVPCGGRGICGKCLVRIEAGRVDFRDSGILPKELLEEGFVLLCRTRVLDSPVRVCVASQLAGEKGQFSEATEDLLMIGKTLLPHVGALSPLVEVRRLTVFPPATGDGLSDLDRLERSLRAASVELSRRIPLSILASLPSVLRKNGGLLAVLLDCGRGPAHLLDLEADGPASAYSDGSSSIQDSYGNGTADPVRSESRNGMAITGREDSRNGWLYGLAVDIGTTTIAVQLVNLTDARIVGSKTAYNAQISCGLDIISRINYAGKAGQLEELREKALTTVNTLAAELADFADVPLSGVSSASIAGNTTMVHLLLGIPPEQIRLAPYTPAVYRVPDLSAAEVGLAIHPRAPIHFAPAVGSYVGGDITSGLLCTSLATDSENICLFIDIGTNGELVLGNRDFLLGCACSAGPAFEGGGIEDGMRASEGAVDRVDVHRDTGLPAVSVIGDGKASGICGSGMVTLIASLFSTGWLDAAGRLDRTRVCAAIDTTGRNASYTIVPGEASATGKAIRISEADIDNLIRAKAAIYSACRMMLRSVDMDFGDLSHLYIAGGFGRYLDLESAVCIGLIPELPADHFSYVGNASVTGAYMTLVSAAHRQKQLELAERLTYLDLSVEPGYMDQYTAAMFLPHTDIRLFPSSGRQQET